jgi:hypothetical protein
MLAMSKIIKNPALDRVTPQPIYGATAIKKPCTMQGFSG